MNFRISLLIGAVLLASQISYAKPSNLTKPASTQTVEQADANSKGNFRFTSDFSNAKVVGKGSYRYRMVLLDPMNNQPLANQDYALSNSSVDFPFVKESKKVYQGKTDEQGRTDVFAFNKAVKSGWNLRPRTGSGPLGEQMVLTDSEKDPLARFDYTLVVCEKNDPYLYNGFTDRSGQTAYVATQTPANIRVYLTGNEPSGGDICK